MTNTKAKKSETVITLKRLEQAKRYMELARISRQVAYAAVPYLVSAELLLEAAIEEQTKHG